MVALLGEYLCSELVAIEVLYGFRGVGEDLVVASVYVECAVGCAVIVHISLILLILFNRYSMVFNAFQRNCFLPSDVVSLQCQSERITNPSG